jgi:hypothetical protein
MNSGLAAAPQHRSADDSVLSDADDRLLRASEVQRELGISRATAYRMMTDGTLPVYRFGGRTGPESDGSGVIQGASNMDRGS